MIRSRFGCLLIYVSGKDSFFVNPLCMYCSVDLFSAFDDVYKIKEVNTALNSRLRDIGLGIKMSRPIKFFHEENTVHNLLASISHYGLFAYNILIGYSPKICFKNLVTGKERLVDSGCTNVIVGFYDDMAAVLRLNCKFGECKVETILKKGNLTVLKESGKYPMLCPDVDTSVVHVTRRIFYTSVGHIPLVFDVDNKIHTRLFEERLIYSFASTTGIDIGVSAVFREWSNGSLTQSLKFNDTTDVIYNFKPTGSISALFPSAKNPFDLSAAIKLYDRGTLHRRDKKGVRFCGIIKYQTGRNFVRIYQDVFLAFDGDTNDWVFIKIVIP